MCPINTGWNNHAHWLPVAITFPGMRGLASHHLLVNSHLYFFPCFNPVTRAREHDVPELITNISRRCSDGNFWDHFLGDKPKQDATDQVHTLCYCSREKAWHMWLCSSSDAHQSNVRQAGAPASATHSPPLALYHTASRVSRPGLQFFCQFINTNLPS